MRLDVFFLMIREGFNTNFQLGLSTFINFVSFSGLPPQVFIEFLTNKHDYDLSDWKKKKQARVTYRRLALPLLKLTAHVTRPMNQTTTCKL